MRILVMIDAQRRLNARTVDFRFQWQDATVLSAHAGFRDVITKPFDLDTLIGQVSRCLEVSLRPSREVQFVELRS